MKKKKIFLKFGVLFRDDKDAIPGWQNLQNYDENEIAKFKLIKPIVYIAFKNLEGYKILKFGDLIVQINKKKINNAYDLLIERNKLKWNSTVNFKIKRNKKYLDLKIKFNSFDYWKKNFPKLGFDVSRKSKEEIR